MIVYFKFKICGESVASVAVGCGYHAEEAFAKAFKRQFGYGPGQARKQGG